MESVIPVVLSLGFLIFGFIWTVGFTIFVLRRRAFLTRSLETTGTVIAVDVRHYRPKNMGSPGSTHHYPTVRFQTADGRVVDCEIKISLHEFYTVGQTVIVNYDLRNPCKRIQLGDREAQPVGTYILFIGVGLLIFIVGLIMTIVQFS